MNSYTFSLGINCCFIDSGRKLRFPYIDDAEHLLTSVLKCSDPTPLSMHQSNNLEHCNVAIGSITSDSIYFRELLNKLNKTSVSFAQIINLLSLCSKNIKWIGFVFCLYIHVNLTFVIFIKKYGCFTKGYRKLYHYKTYIYMNILMKLSQNIHHMNKFLSTEFFNRTPYIQPSTLQYVYHLFLRISGVFSDSPVQLVRKHQVLQAHHRLV